MKQDRSSTKLGASLLLAITASLCCITPVVAAIAGIGGIASTFSWMEPLRPYLIALTIAVLGFAWYQKMKPKKNNEIDCACDDNEKPSFWQSKKFLLIVTIISLLLLAFPHYAEVFYPKKDKKEIVIVESDNIQTLEFSIKGMTCQGCAAHVEAEVDKLPGIVEVSSSYEKANALVKYDKTKVDLADIEAAINNTGYKVIKD